MYRDEGWEFMQLGRVIERSQLLVALLLFQIDVEKEVEEDSDTDWTTLLRAYHAFEAYNRKYSVEVQSGQVLDLLVTDPLIPRSLSRTLDMMAANVSSLGNGSDERSGGEAQRLAGRIGALVHYDWPDTGDHRELLKRCARVRSGVARSHKLSLLRIRCRRLPRSLTRCLTRSATTSSTSRTTSTPRPFATA